MHLRIILIVLVLVVVLALMRLFLFVSRKRKLPKGDGTLSMKNNSHLIKKTTNLEQEKVTVSEYAEPTFMLLT